MIVIVSPRFPTQDKAGRPYISKRSYQVEIREDNPRFCKSIKEIYSKRAIYPKKDKQEKTEVDDTDSIIGEPLNILSDEVNNGHMMIIMKSGEVFFINEKDAEWYHEHRELILSVPTSKRIKSFHQL